MKYGKAITLALSGTVFFFLSCASGEVTPSLQKPGQEQVKEESKIAIREPWEVKWDRIVTGAKKEGKVVVYGAATGIIRDSLVKAFASKYGVPVEYMAAKGPEIAARILAERRANLYYADVIIGASSPSITTLKPVGAFDPLEPVLILPEVIDPKVWWENKIPWVDREQKYFIGFLAYANQKVIVNADVLNPEELKSYRDLLAPKWKAKIAMHDPTIAGAGQSFIAVLGLYIMGMDFLRELAGQELFLSRDHRQLAEWVARGKYPIGLSIEAEAIEQMKLAGLANLKYVPVKEGTYVAMGTGFLSRPNNAPHPNASTLFINWLLSKEGQTVYTGTVKLQSARVDLPTEHIDPLYMRQPGVKYFNTNTEDFWSRGNEYIKLGEEIFGPLRK